MAPGVEPRVEPRVEAAPLGLPRELAERVAAELSYNETALTFRLVHKATAALASEKNVVHLSQPVPEHAFARRWSVFDPLHKGEPLSEEIGHELLRLTCSSGVVANIEVAATRRMPRPVDMAAAAGMGRLEAVQWLKGEYCPWDGSVQEAAAAGGHTEVVAWLAGEGCPWAGGDPLSAALRAAKYDTVQQLLTLGCPIDLTFHQVAASRGHKSRVDWLLSRGPSTEKLRSLLMGAAAGYALSDLQELFPRVVGAYAASIGNSVNMATAEQLLLDKPTGALLGAAAAAGAAGPADGSSTPADRPRTYADTEWQGKVLWLAQDKGFRREVRWDGGELDEDGFPRMGAAEQARRLEWLQGNGFQVIDGTTEEAQFRRRTALGRAALGGGVVGLRQVLDKYAAFGLQLEADRSWAISAVEIGHEQVVDELLARGLATLRDAAHLAAAAGRVPLLSRLLGGGEQGGARLAGGAGGQRRSPRLQERAAAGAKAAGGLPRELRTAGRKVRGGARGVQAAGAAAGAAAVEGQAGLAGVQRQEAINEVLQVGLFHAALSVGDPSWEVLRWLHGRGCPWDEAVFAAAVKCTCSVVVGWMAAKGCPMPADGSPYLAAAERSSKVMLSCLRRVGCPWDVDVIRAAATKHKEWFVQWFKAEGWPMPVGGSPYVDAAAQCQDQADMVWCVQQLGRPWDESAFNLAVGWRTAGLVEWMADNGCPMPADGSPYIHAAARRELGMLECLWRLGCPLRTRPVLREAVRAGAPLEALQWLFGHGLTATDSELRDELEFVGGEMARWTWRDSGRAVRSFLEERLAAVQGGA